MHWGSLPAHVSYYVSIDAILQDSWKRVRAFLIKSSRTVSINNNKNHSFMANQVRKQKQKVLKNTFHVSKYFKLFSLVSNIYIYIYSIQSLVILYIYGSLRYENNLFFSIKRINNNVFLHTFGSPTSPSAPLIYVSICMTGWNLHSSWLILDPTAVQQPRKGPGHACPFLLHVVVVHSDHAIVNASPGSSTSWRFPGIGPYAISSVPVSSTIVLREVHLPDWPSQIIIAIWKL